MLITVAMTPQQLRARRERLGMTQAEIAEKLLTPKDTYRNWEQGHRKAPGCLEIALQKIEGETCTS